MKTRGCRVSFWAGWCVRFLPYSWQGACAGGIVGFIAGAVVARDGGSVGRALLIALPGALVIGALMGFLRYRARP